MKRKFIAEEYYSEGYACSQAVLMAFADEIGLEMKTAKKVSSAFAGGMGRMKKSMILITYWRVVVLRNHGNRFFYLLCLIYIFYCAWLQDDFKFISLILRFPPFAGGS